MTAKMTPGPWIVGVMDDEGWPVFRLREMDDPCLNSEEVRADARAIAALPELIEAMRLVLDDPTDRSLWESYLRRILARIEGEKA